MSAVVVVGAGQAGFQVAVSLRDKGFTGSIDLIGEEPGLPYQRPPLSKQFLTGSGDDDDAVVLRPAAYFEQHLIALHTDRVVEVDRAASEVELASGRHLRYDHLVLATGARNRRLPVAGADLAGVHHLRTLGEAVDLRSRLGTPGRAVVIGGGFIGLEFAAAARALGHEVTVVEALDRVLARAVSAEVSATVLRHHVALGTEFRLDTKVSELLGAAGRVTGVRCADGVVVDADLVVVGIGVEAETALARRSGIDVTDGVVVDEFLRTSDPKVFAIGDCAWHPNVHFGGSVRLESVQNATDHARCVAQAIVGPSEPYRALPWFWSHQGKLNLQIAGLTAGSDLHVIRGDGTAGAFSVFCYRDGRLVGVESVNRPSDHVAARRLLTRGAGLDPSLAADPAFDLKAHSRG